PKSKRRQQAWPRRRRRSSKQLRPRRRRLARRPNESGTSPERKQPRQAVANRRRRDLAVLPARLGCAEDVDRKYGDCPKSASRTLLGLLLKYCAPDPFLLSCRWGGVRRERRTNFCAELVHINSALSALKRPMERDQRHRLLVVDDDPAT